MRCAAHLEKRTLFGVRLTAGREILALAIVVQIHDPDPVLSCGPERVSVAPAKAGE